MSQPANAVGRRIAVYALLALPFRFGQEDPRPTNGEPTQIESALEAGGSFGLRLGDDDKSPDVISKSGLCSGLQVNNTSDTVDVNPGNGVCADASNNCTLRAAVMEANANSNANTICLPAGTFPLTIADVAGDENGGATGDLDITQDVTIVGDTVPGATVIDANGTSVSPRRIFDVQPGLNDPGNIFLGLTLTDGFAGGRGGAIRVQNGSDLVLGLVFLDSNFAAGSGGGIAFEGTSSGTLTTIGITGNSVGAGAKGGGLFVDTGAFVTVLNTEISGNVGTSPDNVGGIHTLGNLNLTNVTVSGNRSLSGTGLQVQGGITSAISATFTDNALAAGDFEVERLGGQLIVQNTILGGDPLRNCSGLIQSQSGNIDTGTTCPFTAGDLSNTNPLLDPLYDNGGFSRTHALRAGSPAIDAATSTNCSGSSTDQRGVPRPQGPACDIGAFERRLFGLSINDVSVAEGNSGTSTATFTVTLAPFNLYQTVTVAFATADGTASSASDYVAVAGSVSFAPMETSKTVTVTINGDTTFESNETFFVNLTNPVNADFNDAQGLGTITNDDAAGTFAGPTPYLSKNASPFLASINAGTTYLEDFECGVLGVPGVTASAGTVVPPGLAGLIDSVDADDGAIDGSGLNGHSFFSGSGPAGITFTFSAATLGALPTQAGIVWTDGFGTTTFEAFAASGASLGTVGPVSIADGSSAGGTAEDRFFGITHAGGILAIKLSNTAGGIEVDHLQYGLYTNTAADLSITKTESPDPVAAGGTLTYTLTVTNAGPRTACQATVTDTLPAGVIFQSASGTGWTCAQASGVVTCTRLNLAVGAAPVITIQVTAPTAAGTLNNTATVATSTSDPPGNNNATATTTVVAGGSADLALSKTDQADPVLAGGALIYSLTVGNAGPNAASSLVLTDTLPSGVTSPSASGPGWSCGVNGSVVTCLLASLASGSSSVVTIQAAAPLTAGTVTNSANVTSATTDPNAANNSDAETTGVTLCSTLAAPANLTASLVGRVLFLNWDPVPGAERYIVELFSQPIATLTANFFGTDLTQPPGTILVFQVRAECGGASSGPSNPVTVVVPPLNCAAPSAPAPSIPPVALGQPGVLTWTDTLAGRPGVYRVSRSVDGGPFTEVAVTSGTSLTGPAVTLEDVPRTILYVVRAELLCGGATLVGPESAGIALCILPSQVTNLRLENAFNPSAPISPVDPIRILWQAGPVPGVSYAYRINGATAPPFAGTTTETSAVVPPAGLDFSQIEAFVTAFRCDTAIGAASPEARSEPVTVANLPPVAEFTISPNPRAGAPITFTDTSLRAVTYLWTTNEGQTATTQHFTITFSSPGEKEVALIVSNGVGTDTEIKRFTVGSAAATVARAMARAEPFVAANPEQRRAPVRIPGPGTTTLRIVSKEEETVVIYLRLLEESGRSVFEKRLVVAGGAEALYDIGAWGFRGDFTVELVSRRRFEANVLGGRPTGRPSPREVRR